LLVEIEADRDVPAGLVERLGSAPGGVKEWGAAEKVSRLKLKHGSTEGLGTFEAIEFLVLGTHGGNWLSGEHCHWSRVAIHVCAARILTGLSPAPRASTPW
jgi:hypothetical protein